MKKYCKHEFDRHSNSCLICGKHWQDVGKEVNIIGICGKKGSGKDYVGKLLIDNYGFTKYSFADPLKRGVQQMFDFSDEQCWGDQSVKETVDPRWGISPRDALQIIGTDLLRKTLPNIHRGFAEKTGDAIWVNNFKYWIEKNKHFHENIVIPDVRFMNEINIIKEMGGDIWHVDASDRVGDTGDTHGSENEWCQYNFETVVDNNNTVQELEYSIKKLLGE